LAGYLGAFRGIPCRPEQIVITAGGQQALALCGLVLVKHVEAVLLEEPGYLGARLAFHLAGLQLRPVPVDEQGLRPDCLPGNHGPAAIYLTPSHQFPLGFVLSLRRRFELLQRAHLEGLWLIEDDYDAEFRYQGEPLTALAGLDGLQRVIYLGTFSKVMSPELRVGYVVLPEKLIAEFAQVQSLLAGPAPVLVQAAIARFIEQGHFFSHIQRMRSLYAQKRESLLGELARCSGCSLLANSPTGMHLPLMLGQGFQDGELSQELRRFGFDCPPLSPCYMDGPKRQGLLLGFTAAKEGDFFDLARKLSEFLAPLGG